MHANAEMGRVRERPYVSLNKLLELLTLPGERSRRRVEILQDLKYPHPFKAAWYGAARRLIAQALATGDFGWLGGEIDRLVGDVSGTVFQRRLRVRSAEALRVFESEVVPQLRARNVLERIGFAVARRAGRRSPKLMIEGVEVSVAPDVMLLSREEGSVPRVGLIKLNINASFGLSRQGGLYGGTLLELFGQEHLAGLGAPRLDHCLMLDVFGSTKVHAAPERSFRRRQRIAATCREIAMLWPGIPRPAGRVAVAS